MRRAGIALGLLLSLCLVLSACGNKGPLVPAEEEKQQKRETSTY